MVQDGGCKWIGKVTVNWTRVQKSLVKTSKTQTQTQIIRWFRKPSMIGSYNRTMGAVDRNDAILETYMTQTTCCAVSRRSYERIGGSSKLVTWLPLLITCLNGSCWRHFFCTENIVVHVNIFLILLLLLPNTLSVKMDWEDTGHLVKKFNKS